MNKINPVKAAITAYKNGNCGIHELNNACFSVCSAYNGGQTAWDITQPCAKQCDSLIEEMRIKTYGSGYCDHHAPNRPVLWNQIPHYFPNLYNQTKNTSQALQECIMKCRDNKLSEECIKNCKLDSYAIVEKKPSPPRVSSSVNKLKAKPQGQCWIIIAIKIIGILLGIFCVVLVSDGELFRFLFK